MKKLYFILFLLLLSYRIFPISSKNRYTFPSDNFFNYGYGLVYDGGSYWISSDSSYYRKRGT